MVLFKYFLIFEYKKNLGKNLKLNNKEIENDLNLLYNIENNNSENYNKRIDCENNYSLRKIKVKNFSNKDLF